MTVTEVEQLIELYGQGLQIKYVDDMPDKLSGIIVGHTIYMNSNLHDWENYCTLAEEFGHYYTGTRHNITNYCSNHDIKEESTARRWGYQALIPYSRLKEFLKGKETVAIYDIAEEFRVPNDVVQNVIEYYKCKGKL
ncbi:ImmA/IrrE family metallo-endopeptidase [Aerococcus urinae]|uniref:ImmA/IrrE family metallo-endopeptidase n=1 Tax=Aerococcus urinae TaxID=1376 RepID=UPI002156F710|nr:ImmA/IrrE family metallo-endopeptidase [Aerococcus urinae]